MRFETALHQPAVMLVTATELRAGLHEMEIAELLAAVGTGDILQRCVGQRFAKAWKPMISLYSASPPLLLTTA